MSDRNCMMVSWALSYVGSCVATNIKYPYIATPEVGTVDIFCLLTLFVFMFLNVVQYITNVTVTKKVLMRRIVVTQGVIRVYLCKMRRMCSKIPSTVSKPRSLK